MNQYRVTKEFNERFDDKRRYNVNDIYPRFGFKPPEGRAEALCVAEVSELNKEGCVYLAVIEPEPPNEPTKEPEPETEQPSLEGLTKADLLKYAEERGVEGVSAADTKAVIMAAIVAHNKPGEGQE